ncbi:efflux RND transporter periplasmic adaptor subunit [Rhodoferax sp. TH121]|uniref:efflux RND transporter periplasmic adaptor subunit n=1 Tax=Rhodoferax sp. TH121 TaxID=2022803 RepID=UPI0015962C00|nr:efflux RND transporter periplasmic adaptor subunit [Rhodoferax sp. TH121]
MTHTTHIQSLRHRHLGLMATLGLAAALAWVPASVRAQASPTFTIGLKQSGASTFLDGVVQPVKQSTVSAQASGRIASFVVKAGDKVKAGQLLATIDDREASVGQQRSQAQVDQADADLRNAKANFDRTKDLQAKGFISQAALDTADAQLKSAKAQRDQASAAIRQSSLAQGFTRVTAPFDGWVLQTDAQAGDLAVPGKPLLVIYAPLPLRVVVQVPASRAVLVGQAANVQVQAGEAVPGAWITPSATSVIPSSDPVSQTTEWRLELPAAQSAGLVPGLQVRVKFSVPAATNRSLLAVPEQAIVRRGELTAVYVKNGEVFTLRAVRLGQTLGADGTEVLAGLKAGDVVALDTVRAAQARPTAQ